MVKASIIIPCYNMHATIGSAVESALQQGKGVEVIVVDDGSSPPLVLEELCAKNGNIRLLRQEINRGVAATRNAGVAAAAAPWITFLDADDRLQPKSVLKRIEFAEATIADEELDPALVLFGAAWCDHDGSGQPLRIRQPRPTRRALDFASGCWWCPGSLMLCRKEVFTKDALAFDENLRRLEDFDFGIRFGLAGGRLIVDPACGAHIRPSNLTDRQQITKVANQLRSKYRNHKNDAPQFWRRMNAYLELELAAYSFREGKLFSTLRHLAFSMLLVPRLQRHFSPGWSIHLPMDSSDRSPDPDTS